MAGIEKYCCTCGVSKGGQSSGNNPTTMCSNCAEEKPNYCIRCREDLSNAKETIVLCKSCRYQLAILRHKTK